MSSATVQAPAPRNFPAAQADVSSKVAKAIATADLDSVEHALCEALRLHLLHIERFSIGDTAIAFEVESDQLEDATWRVTVIEHAFGSGFSNGRTELASWPLTIDETVSVAYFVAEYAEGTCQSEEVEREIWEVLDGKRAPLMRRAA